MLVALLISSILGIGLKTAIARAKPNSNSVSDIVLRRNQAIKKAQDSGQKTYDFKIKGPLPIGGF